MRVVSSSHCFCFQRYLVKWLCFILGHFIVSWNLKLIFLKYLAIREEGEHENLKNFCGISRTLCLANTTKQQTSNFSLSDFFKKTKL